MVLVLMRYAIGAREIPQLINIAVLNSIKTSHGIEPRLSLLENNMHPTRRFLVLR